MTHIPAIITAQGVGNITTLMLPLLVIVCYVVLIVWLVRWFIAYKKRIQRVEEQLEQLQHAVNTITRTTKK